MPNSKAFGSFLQETNLKARMRFALLVDGMAECTICHTDGLTHIVKNGNNATSLLSNEIQTVLIVGEVDERPFYSLALILLLFDFQDKIIELLLQSLVGVVDATNWFGTKDEKKELE